MGVWSDNVSLLHIQNESSACPDVSLAESLSPGLVARQFPHVLVYQGFLLDCEAPCECGTELKAQ
jgi:hypothetical protein